jgi:hypothetical protein
MSYLVVDNLQGKDVQAVLTTWNLRFPNRAASKVFLSEGKEGEGSYFSEGQFPIEVNSSEIFEILQKFKAINKGLKCRVFDCSGSPHVHFTTGRHGHLIYISPSVLVQ